MFAAVAIVNVVVVTAFWWLHVKDATEDQL
jgi:hypothetical protein